MIDGSAPEGAGRGRAASPHPGEGSAFAAGRPGGSSAGGTAAGGPSWRSASAWGRAGQSGRLLREAFGRRSDGVRPVAHAAAAAVRPALPDWIGADVERLSLRRAERRVGRPRQWARRWAAGRTAGWSVVAAASPIVAVAGQHESWLVVGAAAVLRAGLAGWETARLRRDGEALPAPSAAPPRPWQLRGSAAAEPLRRGEAGLSALVAMTRSVGSGPARTMLRGAVAGGVELVDGLRVGAARVVACETAIRAVADPARRAELVRSRDGLAATMRTSTGLFDDLLVAAAEVIAGVSPAAGGLDRLEADTQALRQYAAALRDLAV